MLNPKSLLKVLPAVLLSVGQMVGISEVGRSQNTPPLAPPPSQAEQIEINRLIPQLRSDNPDVRRCAAAALGSMGKSAIPV
jgi:hypothetical protein